MLRTTFKNLAARKLRLVTTSIAVLLGVAFMAGTLVLTDTIGKTFDSLFADVNAGTNAYVRGKTAFSSDMGDQRPRLDQSVLATVRGVEGVAVAEPAIEGYAQIVDKAGKPMGDPGMGAPTFGGNWLANDTLNPFTLSAGRAPQTDSEVVIDKASADKAGHVPGDTVTGLTQAGTNSFTLVGVAKFGAADSPGGASFALFTDAAAQQYVTEPGKINAVKVVSTGDVSDEDLARRIAASLPAETEVLTGAEITAENQSDIQQGLSFFNTFLMTFALIALFVGSFIIYNSFSILVAQRTKELALLRAIGASRRQVLGSVLFEAAAVGLIASVLGLVAGVGVAAGLKALLSALGIDIPAGGVVLSPKTVVVSLVAGLGVSVVSAVFPARRAAKVPPIAAMRDVAVDTSSRSRKRMVVGAVVTGLGAVLLANGLFADGGVSSVGSGAALVFVGVAILGPVFAKPLSWLLGAPLPRLKGMTGTLARENAMRNPKRTSATAAALMIGVALVGLITILASSTKASINTAVDNAFTGDLVIESGTFGFGGLSPELAQRVSALPEVDAAAGLRTAPVEIDGGGRSVLGGDPVAMGRLFDVGVTAGSLDDLDQNSIAVHDDVATEKGWKLGDAVPVRFAETGLRQLRIAALYSEENVTGQYFVGLPVFEANVPDQFDMKVFVNLAEGVDPAAGAAAVKAVAADYPSAEVQDRTEFKAAQAAQIDQMLNLMFALLFLAVFIALLGIANTLALSIFERTRELGLLRAVGMTRGQLRATVRWESVIIALLGTVMGLAIATLFGWAMVEAMGSEGLNEFRLPVGQLAVITLVAALAGVGAAVLPARRAGKLNVLNAIATA